MGRPSRKTRRANIHDEQANTDLPVSTAPTPDHLVLNTWRIPSFILPTTLRSRSYYQTHLTYEETEAGWLSKALQPGSNHELALLRSSEFLSPRLRKPQS